MESGGLVPGATNIGHDDQTYHTFDTCLLPSPPYAVIFPECWSEPPSPGRCSRPILRTAHVLSLPVPSDTAHDRSLPQVNLDASPIIPAAERPPSYNLVGRTTEPRHSSHSRFFTPHPLAPRRGHHAFLRRCRRRDRLGRLEDPSALPGQVTIGRDSGPCPEIVVVRRVRDLVVGHDVVLTPAPGNLEQLFDRDAWGFHDELAQQYGPIVKLNAVLGVRTSSIRSPACHSVVRPSRTNGFTSSTLPRYAASSSRSRARTTKSPGLSSASPTLAPAYSQPILIDV